MSIEPSKPSINQNFYIANLVLIKMIFFKTHNERKRSLS